MQQGRRPHAVGLFFSLGHCTVVILACAAIGLMSATLRARFSQLSDFGVAATAVSVGCLMLIAAANAGTLVEVWRDFRTQRFPSTPRPAGAVVPSGTLVRLFRPLLGVISSPWQMFPLGFLFGLGFDTATTIGVLAIAVGQASQGAQWSIMVVPALFTAGMALVDTSDAVLMARAYGWAFDKPRRKLAYNLVMTLVSIGAAVLVGSLQALDLLSARFAMSGGFWLWIGAANHHFSAIGAGIVLVLVGYWGISLLIYRPRAGAKAVGRPTN